MTGRTESAEPAVRFAPAAARNAAAILERLREELRDGARVLELGQACGFGPSRRKLMSSDNRLVVWDRVG